MGKIRSQLVKIFNYFNIKKLSKLWAEIVENLVTALFGEVGAAVLAFIFTFSLIFLIGSELYGVFVVLTSITTIVTRLCSFQSWQGVIRFGSQAIYDRDSVYFQSIIKNSLLIDSVFTVIGIISLWSLSPFIIQVIGLQSEHVVYLRVMSLAIILNLNSTPTGLFRTMNKFKYISIYRIISNLLKVVFFIILSGVFNYGLLGAVISFVMGDILGVTGLYIYMLITIQRDSLLSLRGVIFAPLSLSSRSFIKFSFWTNLTTIIDIPSKEFDSIILSQISFEAVAVFKVYKQIGQVLDKFVNPVKQVVLPRFSSLIAEGDEKESFKLMKVISKKSLQILIPAIIIMSAGTLIVLHILFDDVYTRYWYVLILYLIARGMALATSTIHPLFIALDYVKLNSFYALIANVTYIIFALLLVGKFGLLGIIFSLFVEYSIMILLKYRKLTKHFQTKSFSKEK